MRTLVHATSESRKPSLAPPQRSRAPHRVQAKLVIAAQLDPAEHEADRIAREVMRAPGPRVEDAASPRPQSPVVGATGPASVETIAAPPIVDEVLTRPGQPLDAHARAFMEPRFGRDLSRVRVHADELASRSAHAVGAHAYTVGSQIVFGQGRYAPTTPEGRELLAHELAHVAQQSAPGVVARRPTSPTKPPKAPVTSKTVFNPGVMHNHQPSGRWADVRANPRTEGLVGFICRHHSPRDVINLAASTQLSDKPLAADHMEWFLAGSGKDYVEDRHLEEMLRTDAGVQEKLKREIPSGRTNGYLYTHLAITQDNYRQLDFQYAFGEIDQLDFEVDFDAGTLHAWFQDRYEWHPVFPFYAKLDGDYERLGTNCVHAAAVELKSDGAKDFWMKGEATLPLEAIRAPAHRDADYLPTQPL